MRWQAVFRRGLLSRDSRERRDSGNEAESLHCVEFRSQDIMSSLPNTVRMSYTD
jgi:hypothetical protein